MPTFCRHNRFIERCPICSKTLPDSSPQRAEPKRSPSRRTSPAKPAVRAVGRPRGSEGVRVHHESRFADDGYRSRLVPGLRSSTDAQRLAQEIAFAAGRLTILNQKPPELYADVRALGDIEQASWVCFLATYLSPLQEQDAFRGIRAVLAQPAGDWHSGLLPDLEAIPLGPRSSHDPARGLGTLRAYRRWAQNSGSQAQGLGGDPDWTAQRRFERAFERLAIAGFSRAGRYELLVTLGTLGLYELRAEALHPAPTSSRSPDLMTTAAKRIFGIGDTLNIERRAQTLAQQINVPLASLDLALANWGSGERATLGFDPDIGDQDVLHRAESALGL